MIDGDDVRAAATVLAGVANCTPVVTSRTLDERVGARVYLKCENLQRGGAFKFRGAYNKIASLPPGVDVLAYSSGNHAQAVALASRLLGRRATILMPEDAPPSKLEATRGYGAEVVTYDRYAQDREALGEQLAVERGLELVKPYDDQLIMAGQGTAALELLDEVGELDLLLTPVGGGGLLAGAATIAKERGVARVVGVEPAAGDDVRQSLERGERVKIDVPRTIADGLQTTSPGALTFEVLRRLVDEVVTVTDPELVEAMRFAFERLKLVIEPSGAAGLAALLAGAVPAEGRIGVVVSGGNVGADRFAELVVS
jgi:threo-3-hydroxy-L-aspartate ammonia-lyase